MAPPTIRHADQSDAAALSELVAVLGSEASSSEIAARLANLPQSGHALFLAELDGRPRGWLHVFLTWRLTAPPFAEIGGLAVAPEARRRGLARALIAAGERWAKAEHAVALRIRVGLDRQEAPELYRTAGFRPLKHQQVFVKEL